MPISIDKKHEILKLYTTQDITVAEIARRVDVSYNTVKNHIRSFKNNPKYKKVIAAHKEQTDEFVADLLDVIKSQKVSTIVNNALNLYTKERMEAQADNNLQTITALVGMFMDKALKLENLNLQRENNELKNKIIDKTRQIVFMNEDDDENNVQLSS